MALAVDGLLSHEQVAGYAELGYLQLDSFISQDWLDRLRSASAEFVEQSRSLGKSTQAWISSRHTPPRHHDSGDSPPPFSTMRPSASSPSRGHLPS